MEKTTISLFTFRPNLACSFLVSSGLLGIVLIGTPRIGVSQQPNAASATSGVLSSPATSDPLISLPSQKGSPLTIQGKLAQGPAGRRHTESKSSGKPKRQSGEAESHVTLNSRLEVSVVDEVAVQGFVKEHHPELADVLRPLKSQHAQAYARAIADLNRTRERLKQIQSRDEERYERELAMWKTKSRIQLLVVRIKMNLKDATLLAEFKSLVGQQVQQHQEQLLAEQRRIRQRLEKIEEQLGKLSGNSDQLIERQMKQWLASGDSALRKQVQRRSSSKTQQAKVKSKSSATVPVRADINKKSEP